MRDLFLSVCCRPARRRNEGVKPLDNRHEVFKAIVDLL